MRIREHQVGHRRCLVQRGRESDLEGNQRERIAEPGRRRQGVGGVGPGHDRHAVDATAHFADRLRDFRVRRSLGVGRVVDVHGAAQTAGRRVEDENSEVCRRGGLVVPRCARPKSQSRARFELIRERRQRIGFDSCRLGGLLEPVRGHKFGVRSGVGASPYKLARDGQGDLGFRTRLGGNPLVGVLSGQGKARSHKDELPLGPVIHPMHGGEVRAERNR